MGEYQEYIPNKYIFIKQNVQSIPKATTILVNPRFKDNTKVYINPNFSAYKTIATPRPNVHVNPNVIRAISSASKSNVNHVMENYSLNRHPLTVIPTDDKGRVLVSTKNKLIKIPESQNNIKANSNDNVISNISSNCHSILNSVPVQKIVSTRTKVVNASIQNHVNNNITSRRSCLSTRFNFFANNVIFKNTRFKSLININGIFYHNSQSVLKKSHIVRQQKGSSSITAESILKTNKEGNTPKLKRHSSFTTISGKTSLLKLRKKLVPFPTYKKLRKNNCQKITTSIKTRGPNQILRYSRYKVASLSKMKKSNMPCPIYKKFGRCNGQKNGTCVRVHNPDQIILCTKFLQGACIKSNCLLSHKVSPEKMPTCKYFLEGLCSKEDCQYLHVKISPKADICKDFLQGFCKEGTKCNRRHQFLCPDFEKFQKCSKKRCEYPHRNSENTLGKSGGKSSYKKLIRKNNVGTMPEKKTVKMIDNIKEKSERTNIRYYEDEVGKGLEVEETLIAKKPKLGSLPAFIPFCKELQENTE
ncbi:hypothetical protein HHI36_019188 [Cryptolaemus montrouzieri]|uniref:Zinc finger CCCH domain-containing protein 3 n=1 Tax=Cryptolaemus montrouzieri TaxID=559131 RepID=A0ABD2P286_9CUCU